VGSDYTAKIIFARKINSYVYKFFICEDPLYLMKKKTFLTLNTPDEFYFLTKINASHIIIIGTILLTKM
jgi:hypothetical protein